MCVETCRSSLFVISTIIVTDFYVHSLVELKIMKQVVWVRCVHDDWFILPGTCQSKTSQVEPMFAAVAPYHCLVSLEEELFV